MFFILGISSAKKKLDFFQTIICPHCGQFGRFEVFMTYTYFSFFFIPIMKWNKKFFVQSSCCDIVYPLDFTLGKRILNGEHVTLHENDFDTNFSNQSHFNRNICPKCGRHVDNEFLFCPNCVNKL